MVSSPYEKLDEVRRLVPQWEALRDEQQKRGFTMMALGIDRCLQELRRLLSKEAANALQEATPAVQKHRSES